jgi:hypothetical protein
MTLTPPGRPAGLRTSVRTVLRGRLLLTMSWVDAETGVVDRLPWETAPAGLVLTGKPDYRVLRHLRRIHPDLIIACEPAADSEHLATVADPFLLPETDLLGPFTLERFLNDQRDAGASFALTPTGHVRAGETDAAKAAIDQANDLDRDDVVVRLPLDATVMRTHPEQVVAIALRSRHPIALSLFADQDPMERRGIVESMHAFTHAVENSVLWRSDIAAFAHLVGGGLSAGAGFLPSLRHGLAPGKTGRKINAADLTPHVLLAELLRYMRTSELQRRYASTAPPRCDDAPCNGAPLDRFTGSRADRLAAHEHNAVSLLALAGELAGLHSDERISWWRSRLIRSVQAHEQASRGTQQHWPLPPVLAAWAKLYNVPTS